MPLINTLGFSHIKAGSTVIDDVTN